MVEYASPESVSVFVPLVAPVPLLICPLLHSMVQVKVFPSGSFIGILQGKLKDWTIVPFVGVGMPTVGGRFPIVMKVNHFLVYWLLPVGSVAFTQIL